MCNLNIETVINTGQHLLQPGNLDGDCPIGCCKLLCSRWAERGSNLVSPFYETNNPCALPLSALTRRGPMELVYGILMWLKYGLLLL